MSAWLPPAKWEGEIELLSLTAAWNAGKATARACAAGDDWKA